MSSTPIDKQILVTSALPNANGHIHIGHLVEYIQTDIWVRFKSFAVASAIYICADDTARTAIMIRARQENRPETELIADMQRAHERDFAGLMSDSITMEARIRMRTTSYARKSGRRCANRI